MKKSQVAAAVALLSFGVAAWFILNDSKSSHSNPVLSLIRSTGIVAPVEVTATKAIRLMIEEEVCHEAIRTQIEKWDSKGDWVRFSHPLQNPQVFRTPTGKIGQWIEVRKDQNGRVRLARLAEEKIERTSFGEKCAASEETVVAKVAKEDRSHGSQESKDGYTDSELEKAILSGKGGLVYAWSPNMPLSVQGYAGARAAAEKAGVQFIPVLDPGADLKLLARTPAAAQLPAESRRQIRSVELVMRGMLMHFPSALVFDHGQFKGGIYPGLESEQGYATLIRERTGR